MNEPHLTSSQRNWRIGISGTGGAGAWLVGFSAAEIAAGAGSWAGPIGIVAGGVATFVWIKWVQPRVFKNFGLDPQRSLTPLKN